MAGFFESLFSGGTNALGYNELLKRLSEDKGQVGNEMDAIRDQVIGAGSFQPWSAKSSIGQSGMDASGNLSYNLSPQQQAQQNALASQSGSMYGQSGTMDPRFSGMSSAAQGQGSYFGNQARAMDPRMAQMYNQQNAASNQFMQRSLQDTAGRESDIYGRLRAMQRPEEQRQQESMQAGLFGSGRGGMASDAYGGTPEEMAYNKARAEAMNTASYQAMGQAQQEMMNQGSLAGQYGGMAQSAFGQGLQGQQMMGQLGQGYNQLAQSGLAGGTQRQTALGQMGQGYDQLAQQGLTAGGNLQGQQAQIAQMMQQGQYLPMEMLLKQQTQGLQGSEMYGKQGANMAQMLADLGLGEMGTRLNYGNLETDAFSNMIAAAGGLMGGAGAGLDSGIEGAGGFMDFLKGFF